MQIIKLVLLLVIFTEFAFGQPETAKQPFEILITTDLTTVRAGDPIPIKVALTNTSGKDLNVSGGFDRQTGLRSSHSYEIRGPSGTLIPKKPHKQNGPLTGSVIFETLGAGESSLQVEDISRAYDLNQPGRYVIQVSRAVPGDPKHAVVKSNTIVITVTP